MLFKQYSNWYKFSKATPVAVFEPSYFLRANSITLNKNSFTTVLIVKEWQKYDYFLSAIE
jgi:hypothetical protein